MVVIEALEEAVERKGRLKAIRVDHWCQFTSKEQDRRARVDGNVLNFIRPANLEDGI
jgi:hypothetical protein